MKRKMNPDPTYAPMASEQDNPFFEAGQTLAVMESEGTLPEGFDLEAACSDPKFAALVQEFPVGAAVRIYSAEQRAEQAEEQALKTVSERMTARKALPRSTHANQPIAATPDYMAMSPEAFKKLEEQLKTAARSGRKMKI